MRRKSFPTGEAIGNGRGAAWCAATLAEDLRVAGLEQADGWPVFDLLLIGIGGDGHVLSVFPGSAALDSTELALAIPAPTHIEPHVERVTLNPAIVRVARELLAVVTGDEKAVGVFLASHLETLGYQVARQEVAADRFNIIATTGASPRVVF